MEETCHVCGGAHQTGECTEAGFEQKQEPKETEQSPSLPPDIQASLDIVLRNFSQSTKETPPIRLNDLDARFTEDPDLFSTARAYLESHSDPAASGMLSTFEGKIEQKLRSKQREFLIQTVEELSQRTQEEGEVDDLADRARTLIEEIMKLEVGKRAEGLKKVRAEIEMYKTSDPDFDELPPEYAGMTTYDFDDLLRLLPNNSSLLPEAMRIFQMPLEDLQEELEEYQA